jgi:plastocyanin
MSRPPPLAPLLVAAAVAAGGTAAACKKQEAPAPATAPAPGAPAPAAPAAAAPAAPGTLGGGTISGSVRLAGSPPPPRPITTPDPYCSRSKLEDEEVLVRAGGKLQNVLVRLTKGVTGSYPPPSAPAVVDQVGCMYRPRVQGAIVGQKVEIRNSDQTLHNVHTYRGASTMFNQAQLPGMGPMIKTIPDGEQVIRFRCDVHPWMTGYVAMSSHPFFAVTGADGAFRIEKVPPGTYTVEAWHERLGTKSTEVTVADDKPATISFELAVP